MRVLEIVQRDARSALNNRDDHLFAPGPKRILALGGGGVRGIISIAFLERLEALLRARHLDPRPRILHPWPTARFAVKHPR